jgi:putative spermidine/putrescine transport system ATP-binding protein
MTLSLRGVTVRLNGRTVLEDINLSLRPGEVLALLGPAGSGKTALLQTVAGLLRPEQGSLLRDERDITTLAVERRGIGMMLQPALAPRRTLLRNLTQASRLRRAAAQQQAHDLTEAFGLAAAAEQPVSALSLGDRQRAELVRALLDRPGSAVLDDPLTAQPPGDRLALLALARRQVATLLIATHDHTTALAAAHCIAVLRDGKLLQVGTPEEIYDTPRSAFVARFVGGTNILRGMVREIRPGRMVVVVDGVRVQYAAAPDAPRPMLGSPLILNLRPERIGLLFGGEAADNAIDGSVTAVAFQGAVSELTVQTALGALRVRLPGWRSGIAPVSGAAVRLGWAADAAMPLAED